MHLVVRVEQEESNVFVLCKREETLTYTVGRELLVSERKVTRDRYLNQQFAGSW